MEQKNENNKIVKYKRFKLRHKIVFIGVISVILLMIVVISSIKKNKIEISSIKEICEFATLECYYHNVAERRKGEDDFFNMGYKKYWIEYEGTVKFGIDASQINISKPNWKGIIKVYVPEGKVLSVNVDENSFGKIIEETGIFTSISTEEELSTYTEEQNTMQINAENDQIRKNQAREVAMELIENYIENIGEQIGKNYTIEWCETPFN